ncbi:hypothetical protein PPUN110474_52070 [Pseudomonas putida]|nr:hypothetical protein PPUN110474_52070 [Pseudomonas putida]
MGAKCGQRPLRHYGVKFRSKLLKWLAASAEGMRQEATVDPVDRLGPAEGSTLRRGRQRILFDAASVSRLVIRSQYQSTNWHTPLSMIEENGPGM